MSIIVIHMIVNIISYFRINSAHVFDMYIIIVDVGTSKSLGFFDPGTFRYLKTKQNIDSYLISVQSIM